MNLFQTAKAFQSAAASISSKTSPSTFAMACPSNSKWAPNFIAPARFAFARNWSRYSSNVRVGSGSLSVPGTNSLNVQCVATFCLRRNCVLRPRTFFTRRSSMHSPYGQAGHIASWSNLNGTNDARSYCAPLFHARSQTARQDQHLAHQRVAALFSAWDCGVRARYH